MLEIFNVLNLVSIGVAAFTTVVVPETTYMPVEEARVRERELVSPITVRDRVPMWSDSACTYTGVLVPYARDWQQLDESEDPPRVIREADPEKVVGQAVVLNTRTCPGKEREKVLFAGESPITAHVLLGKTSITVTDVETMNKDVRYKWLPQVLARVEAHAAKGNDAAIGFVTNMQALVDARKAQAQAPAGTPPGAILAEDAPMAQTEPEKGE
jgi:hypothetical protein